MARDRICWKTALVVVALTAGAFFPLLLGGFEFVNFDDKRIVYENPEFLRQGGPRLAWMFSITKDHMGHYQPLTWLSLALDLRLFGIEDASGWHVTNLVLHLANAFLAFVLFSLLLRCIDPEGGSRIRIAAASGALLFAVHPLRVESVAWVTERRDVLSGFFYLLALMLYVRRHSGGSRSTSWVTAVPVVLAFTLSLLAKAWGITFFVVLLLLDAYPLRRFGREPLGRILLEKVPLFLVAVTFAILASEAQSIAGAARPWELHGLTQRVAQAAYGLCFYVGKTVWPSGLSCLYQLELRPPGLDPFRPVHVAGMLTVLAVSIALVLVRRRLAWLSVAFFAYAVIVSPVLGFSQSGPQKVADRYSYLSCLPLAMLGAGALSWYLRGPARRTVALCVPAVFMLLLGMLTCRQTGVWRNSVTLWENACRIDPHSEIGLFNLGRAYETAGRIPDAVRCYRFSCVEDPRQLEPRKNLGILLASRLYRYDEAIRELETLLSHHPRDPEAWYSIGLCHQRRERLEEARTAFLEAVKLFPDYAPAHLALAETCTRLGRHAEAARHRALGERRRRR